MESSHYDEQLWFIQEGCDEKHYLQGNPHTFPGRMAAWCPKQQQGFCVSKSEIQECSVAARYWIQGFLSGNEPAYPTDDEGYPLESEDDPQIKKWRAAIQLFAKTGVWVRQERVCEQCGEELLPSTLGLVCERCLEEGIH
ncbi:MAG TPA: hypothetical protein VFV38_30865 [Ktedonobacteraceae bacterium]|nr:hypothetical protein [Ktedonobacteraceae bacterium]